LGPKVGGFLVLFARRTSGPSEAVAGDGLLSITSFVLVGQLVLVSQPAEVP